MTRIETADPFAWIRWGDGDVVSANKMHGTQHLWPSLENMYVAVGLWWMCNEFSRRWNEFALLDYTFVDYFYLPMGDPCDDGMDEQRRYWVNGFINVSMRTGRRLVMVGPWMLKGLPFLHAFVDERNADRDILRSIDLLPTKSVVMVSKGTHAKRIVTLAFANNTRQHTFVDVGRALNPFAGRTEFGRPVRDCCLRGPTREWFERGVCSASS